MRDVVAVATLLTLIFKHAIALKSQRQPKAAKGENKMKKTKQIERTAWKRTFNGLNSTQNFKEDQIIKSSSID